MRKLVNMRLPVDLLARLDSRVEALGQTRTRFVERALESALGHSAVSSGTAESPVSTRGSAQTRAPAKKQPKSHQRSERLAPRRTHASRTPPRPVKRTLTDVIAEADEASERQFYVGHPEVLDVAKHGVSFSKDGERVDPADVSVEPDQSSSGCAECGGDLVAHPEFGRFCTGCGARVR